MYTHYSHYVTGTFRTLQKDIAADTSVPRMAKCTDPCVWLLFVLVGSCTGLSFDPDHPTSTFGTTQVRSSALWAQKLYHESLAIHHQSANLPHTDSERTTDLAYGLWTLSRTMAESRKDSRWSIRLAAGICDSVATTARALANDLHETPLDGEFRCVLTATRALERSCNHSVVPWAQDSDYCQALASDRCSGSRWYDIVCNSLFRRMHLSHHAKLANGRRSTEPVQQMYKSWAKRRHSLEKHQWMQAAHHKLQHSQRHQIRRSHKQAVQPTSRRSDLSVHKPLHFSILIPHDSEHTIHSLKKHATCVICVFDTQTRLATYVRKSFVSCQTVSHPIGTSIMSLLQSGQCSAFALWRSAAELLRLKPTDGAIQLQHVGLNTLAVDSPTEACVAEEQQVSKTTCTELFEIVPYSHMHSVYLDKICTSDDIRQTD
jgi:hypothetical protein